MTKKENFNAIANILNEMGNHDFDEFIAHEVELLGRKKGSTKPTKKQVANEALKERILGILSDEGMTVTEIMTTLNEDNLTNQKVSAVLRLMKENDGTVKKEIVKGKSMFRLA